jgi:FMN phosphatase YigB (HAD superfamily)
MIIRAVFFDVGYTLFDETRLWREWAEWIGVDEGLLLTKLHEVIAQGRDHRDLLGILRPGFDLEAEQMARARAGRPQRFQASDLYSDARPCLANVKARGRRVGVAGNFPSEAIDRVLFDANLPVDAIGGPDRWGASKPSVEFFQRLTEAAGVAAEQIAYVGDRLDTDVIPAKAAGIYGILLQRGPWGEIHAPRAAQMSVPVITSLAKLPFVLRGLRPIRGSSAELTQEDAVKILRLLKSCEIEAWVDGGWGVDALLHNQSRPHDDIDLVVSHSNLQRLAEVLGAAGFWRVDEGARPFNFVMTDREGREIDLHLVVFDAVGDGLYGPQPPDGTGKKYPAAAFEGEGRINDESVRCMTAEYQVANHTGYDLGEADYHDVFALHERFGVPLPDDYAASR